jgi:hypothetical protein
VAASGNVDIFVRSNHGVNPYFHLPMSDPLDKWRKEWFFLWNDTDALLHMLKGSHPVPQPNWGYGVAQTDLHRLQPLCDVIQQLLRGGKMGTSLLRTFFIHRVQPLC